MAYAIWRRSHRIVGSIRRSFHSSESYVSWRFSFLIALASGCVAPPALPLSLDAIREQSLLGEPLRIVVPVVVQPDESLSGECIRVIPSSTDAREGIPEIRSARIALEQVAFSSSIVLTSGLAVNEPAMRITLEVGCQSPLRREYVMLFDPPVVSDPALGTAAPLVANLATEPDPQENAAPPTPAAETATFARAPESAPKPRASPAASSRGGAGKAAARVPAPRRPSKNPSDGSRLAISRTEGGDKSFSPMSKQAQLDAVLEQEVVLRNRVAQLSAMVERMQQEQIDKLAAEVERLQREAIAAQAAQRAAEEAARMSPWAMLARSNGENWQLVALMLALAALLASLIWQRRNLPSRTLTNGERPLMATGQSGFDLDTYADGVALDSGPTPGPAPVRRQPQDVRGTPHGEDSLRFSQHDRDFDQDLDDHSGSRLNPTNA
jgi:pilus assembly protein FimV